MGNRKWNRASFHDLFSSLPKGHFKLYHFYNYSRSTLAILFNSAFSVLNSYFNIIAPFLSDSLLAINDASRWSEQFFLQSPNLDFYEPLIIKPRWDQFCCFNQTWYRLNFFTWQFQKFHIVIFYPSYRYSDAGNVVEYGSYIEWCILKPPAVIILGKIFLWYLRLSTVNLRWRLWSFWLQILMGFLKQFFALSRARKSISFIEFHDIWTWLSVALSSKLRS